MAPLSVCQRQAAETTKKKRRPRQQERSVRMTAEVKYLVLRANAHSSSLGASPDNDTKAEPFDEAHRVIAGPFVSSLPFRDPYHARRIIGSKSAQKEIFGDHLTGSPHGSSPGTRDEVAERTQNHRTSTLNRRIHQSTKLSTCILRSFLPHALSLPQKF